MTATLIVLAMISWLGAKQASSSVWAIALAIVTLFSVEYATFGIWGNAVLFTLTTLAVFMSIRPLRRVCLSNRIFKRVRSLIPVMSSTEREALEAGTVSWEGDLFSGSPDFDKLLDAPTVPLTPKEQAFMDGPLNELCRMIDDWEITHQHTDLPVELWQFIREKGFLGMIIPEAYGGLDFSATAQVRVLSTLYGRSISVATTVSVPNSLGPAELLLKYGTSEQKDYYLPRLANGQDIPCFALTAPDAGSDAAAIPDTGIVCKKRVDGKEVIGITLNWNKRYITLCPVATVIGLAFKLFDPDNLLGKGEDIGITCALIPANTPGVVHGRRHFPLNTAFLNGPTQGKDVFIPLDYLIGGADMAGSGWRMLMECLSAGRAISLPCSALGGAQAAALASGAYARVRKQFNVSISQFEGIEEPLARIAANAYMIQAGLLMTAAAIDNGAKPSVAGAILKYQTTERGRKIAMDAMDVHGGKGICLGPNNYLGRGYQNVPISITVEGANILTRCLIIFGQGAIRCHPYVFKQMESVREENLVQFDKAFWGHASFIIANGLKSIGYTLTGGYFISTPKSKVSQYYKLIQRYSTNLAFMADFAMAMMGSKLKRHEKISARLGDVLSNVYLASAVLKQFHDEGEPDEDLPLVKWCCQHLFHECDIAIQGVMFNFRPRRTRFILKLLINPFSNIRRQPSDRLGHRVASLLSSDNPSRQRLTRFVFTEALPNCPLGRLEEGFRKICQAQALEKRIAQAAKEGLIKGLTMTQRIHAARVLKLIDEKECAILQDAEQARQDIIAVDDFTHAELSRTGGGLLGEMVKRTQPKARKKAVEEE